MVIERWGTVSVVPNHCSHIWSVFTLCYIPFLLFNLRYPPLACNIEGLGWEEDITRIGGCSGEGSRCAMCVRTRYLGNDFSTLPC